MAFRRLLLSFSAGAPLLYARPRFLAISVTRLPIPTIHGLQLLGLPSSSPAVLGRCSSALCPAALPRHLCHSSSQRVLPTIHGLQFLGLPYSWLLSAKPSSALGPLRARPMYTYSRPSSTAGEAPLVFCAPLLHARLLSDSTSLRYSLDTSVVSLILNGELWDRSPYDLIRARSYLARVCQDHSLEHAPDIDPELSRSLKAYRWCCMHSDKVQLCVTPTVDLELSRTTQFKSGDWVALKALGIEEHLVVVEDETVLNVIGRMTEYVKNLDLLSLPLQDSPLTKPTIGLFGSKRQPLEFFSDIKLYLEACCIGPKALLITQDHKLFRFFLQSKFVEECLYNSVEGVLGKRGIPVKRAGEIIPGM